MKNNIQNLFKNLNDITSFNIYDKKELDNEIIFNRIKYLCGSLNENNGLIYINLDLQSICTLTKNQFCILSNILAVNFENIVTSYLENNEEINTFLELKNLIVNNYTKNQILFYFNDITELIKIMNTLKPLVSNNNYLDFLLNNFRNDVETYYRNFYGILFESKYNTIKYCIKHSVKHVKEDIIKR